MSSQQQNAPPAIVSQPELALLVFTLLERYHQVAQCFKVLREDRAAMEKFETGTIAPEERENTRAMATGLFNHLFVLVQRRLLAPQDFATVVPPRGARLWLDLVAPLDFAVRQAVAGEAAIPLGETAVEIFYRHYADDGNVMLIVGSASQVDPTVQ